MISPKPRYQTRPANAPRKVHSFVRLIQICGFDSRTATAQASTTPPQTPGFIDYPQAEAALFEEFVGPDGYARVLAADHARHYGEDICTPESIEPSVTSTTRSRTMRRTRSTTRAAS